MTDGTGLDRHSKRLVAPVVVLACAAFGAPAVAGQRPNVVLILSDDAGYNEFGFTGSATFRTPRLDAVAAAGVRFTQAYVVSPVCSPSRAALMTGLYPQRFGYERNISDDLGGL